MMKVIRSALMIGILISSLLVGIAQPEPEEMKCDVTARFCLHSAGPGVCTCRGERLFG